MSYLGVSETMLVGDVVGDAGLAAGLAPGAARLQAQLLAALLEGGQALLRPAGQVDVHGGPHARAQVGGARVEVPVPDGEHSHKELRSNGKHWIPKHGNGPLNLLGVQQELLAGLALDGVADAFDAACQALEDALKSITFRYNEL